MPGSWYRDGTVSVVQGSKTVVGAGTLLSVQAKTGDLFFVLSNGGGEKIYEIESIADNTHLTLVFPYAEESNSAAQYAVVRNFNNTMTAETNAQLVGFLREWKLALQNNFKGDPGENGNTILGSDGVPASAIGENGDWCIDYASWSMYRKESGAWSYRGSLKGGKGDDGENGSKWHSGEGVPAAALGSDGDYYLDATTSDVYRRSAGAWGLDANIRGGPGPKGIPGVLWRGEWNSATAYESGDGVVRNGSSWVSLQPSVGQAPPDPSANADAFWMLLARRGLDGAGAGDMLREHYDSDGDGKVDAAEIADIATHAITAERAAAADSADAVEWEHVAGRPEPYVLPAASVSVLGGVKISAPMTIEAGVLGVQPATASTSGLMTSDMVAKLASLASGGGGSVMLTLFHTTEAQGTTDGEYTALYTGKLLPRLDWHGSALSVLVRRSGTGQIRAAITDGTDTATDEGSAFSAEGAEGTDELSLDVSTLDDSVLWTFSVEGKGSNCNASRVKVTVDPADEFSPPLVASGAGGATNSEEYAELASSTFLPTWLDVDGNGGVVLLSDVSLGTATGADLRITLGTESATVAVSADGITSVRCPFPATAAALVTARIDGRITAGPGAIELRHYQIHIEK